jgi:hypothetical protein
MPSRCTRSSTPWPIGYSPAGGWTVAKALTYGATVDHVSTAMDLTPVQVRTGSDRGPTGSADSGE